MMRLTPFALLMALVGCPADVTLPDVTGGAPAQGGSSPTGTAGTAGGGGAGGTTPADCSALDDACGFGTWLDGACVREALDDGASCDDGLACTTGDHCLTGACVPGTPHECVAQDPCHVATCNDATNLCEIVPGNDGAPCNDDDACSDGDYCAAGSCVPGAPVICADEDQLLCNRRVCVPETGCVDAGDHVGEECWPAADCLEFRCAGATPGGGYCGAIVANQGGACDDGNPCTELGACEFGACFEQLVPNFTPCDDGISCLVGGSCVDGFCQLAIPQCDLTPTEACTWASCSSDFDTCLLMREGGPTCEHPSPCRGAGICAEGLCGGTVSENDGASCDDLDACTTADQCGAGDCTGTPVTSCASDDGCCPAGCIQATDDDCGAVLYMASVDGLPGFFAFDLETEVWSTLPDPPSPPRSRLASDGTRVYVLADDWEIYAFEPPLSAWSAVRAGPPRNVTMPIDGGRFLATIPGGFASSSTPNVSAFITVGGSWVLSGFGGPESHGAGTRDALSGLLYRWRATGEVESFDPSTNATMSFAFQNSFTVEPTSRFGTFWNGIFYTATEATTHQVVKVLPGMSNAVVTSLITADPNPSSDVDPATGLIYLGPSDSAAAFEVFDPVAESLTALPSPPPIPNGYLSSVAVVRAPSTP